MLLPCLLSVRPHYPETALSTPGDQSVAWADMKPRLGGGALLTVGVRIVQGTGYGVIFCAIVYGRRPSLWALFRTCPRFSC